ncbi:MAG: dicarboxylate/amino acid:cation symporter [Tissierellaceae bacterium]|nr:dicarboxylate/amino acid:cation symporter [Tissierellaceae bacterium]
MSKVKDNLLFKLLVAIIIGVVVGLLVNETIIGILMTIKEIVGQFIFFCVPLIIIGFITPAIVELKSNATKMLGATLAIAYTSSVLGGTFSAISGYAIIPKLNIPTDVASLKELPNLVFQLNIPPILSVMSALVFSIMIGLAINWTKSKNLESIFQEFNKVILAVVNKMVIPALPIFIATTFASLSYEGSITRQLPVFISIIIIVLVAHWIWIALLYALGGVISKENPLEVLKHYGPAYVTALGTMSSAATMSVALESARKSKVLDREVIDFVIPFGATAHLCGSVITEVFFVMTISKIIYGQIPPVGTMILFIILLGLFAVAAPGVPGGTVMASLGIVTGVLGFDTAGVALLMSIFALQDSFGTACNITGDGAIALMITGIFKNKKKQVKTS